MGILLITSEFALIQNFVKGESGGGECCTKRRVAMSSPNKISQSKMWLQPNTSPLWIRLWTISIATLSTTPSMCIKCVLVIVSVYLLLRQTLSTCECNYIFTAHQGMLRRSEWGKCFTKKPAPPPPPHTHPWYKDSYAI